MQFPSTGGMLQGFSISVSLPAQARATARINDTLVLATPRRGENVGIDNQAGRKSDKLEVILDTLSSKKSGMLQWHSVPGLRHNLLGISVTSRIQLPVHQDTPQPAVSG